MYFLFCVLYFVCALFFVLLYMYSVALVRKNGLCRLPRGYTINPIQSICIQMLYKGVIYLAVTFSIFSDLILQKFMHHSGDFVGNSVDAPVPKKYMVCAMQD